MKELEKMLNRRLMPLFVPVLICALLAGLWPGLSSAQSVAETAVVGPEVWALPRTAEMIAQNKSITAVVRQLVNEPEGRLLLRYPEGEWGELWGMELQAWLVSLGVCSDRIILAQDYDNSEAVALVLLLPEADAPIDVAIPAPRESAVKVDVDEPKKEISQELE